MKKKIFIPICLVLFFALTLCFFNFNFNSNTKVYAVDDVGYDILAYDVKVNVNENNVYNITETITVNFNEYKHGIFRYIPVFFDVKREDGSTAKIKAKISELDVKFDGSIAIYETSYLSKSDEGDFYVIQIGSGLSMHKDMHTYVVKYDYNVGKDTLNGNDEFYFNIIGTGWDTTINHITFSITMPKTFDAVGNLGFTWGGYGSTNTSDVTYSIVDTTISGSLDRTLEAYEGLTVRLLLEDGYFVGASDNFHSVFTIVSIVVSIVCLILSLIIFICYKSTAKIVAPVNFYPPNNENSFDVAFAYRAKVRQKDVTSLLIYLASKGYLQIKELGRYDFEIKKLKEYDGNNADEKYYMKQLFAHSTSDSVTLKDLRNSSFYLTAQTLMKDKNNKTRRSKLKPGFSHFLSFAFRFMYVLAFVMTLLPNIIGSYTGGGNIAAVCLAGFISIFVSVYFVARQRSWELPIQISFAVLVNIFLILFVSKYFNYLYVIMAVVALICGVLIATFTKLTDFRTKEGYEKQGQIIGFRNFLKTAEKPMLEKLVNENPTYFYDIMPYTYVLDLSKKWIKKFEGINVPPPAWYDGDFVSIMIFSHTMNSFMRSSNWVSRPPINTKSGGSIGGFGGGFSGGGFSGGGVGGGGGSSW